jgi:hypothetical protein
VYVAFKPPFDSIRAAMSTPAKVQGNMWFLSGNMATVARDSVTIGAAGIYDWTRRLAPGVYVSRTEASAEGARRGGRATNVFEAGTPGKGGLPISGFAISDMLLALQAEPRSGADKRWTDLAISPLVGTIPRASQITLVWENYEFGNKGGSSTYDVSVTVTRGRSIAGQISATVIGALAGIAKIDRTQDHVAVTFNRSVPYAPAFDDHITLSLAQSPPGPYTVTLTVLDKITGQTATRTKTFRIR